MHTTIMILVATLRETFLGRASRHLENLALRQQVAILKRERGRPWLQTLDRLFWVILSRLWPRWREALVIVRPETVIGTIRRECLDHVIVLSERHLRRILSPYFDYYHRSRTHLSLEKDCPEPRPIHPPNGGKVVAFPQIGGLHHRYERLAA